MENSCSHCSPIPYPKALLSQTVESLADSLSAQHYKIHAVRVETFILTGTPCCQSYARTD